MKFSSFCKKNNAQAAPLRRETWGRPGFLAFWVLAWGKWLTCSTVLFWCLFLAVLDKMHLSLYVQSSWNGKLQVHSLLARLAFSQKLECAVGMGAGTAGKRAQPGRNQRKRRAEPPGRSTEHHSYFWEVIIEEGGRRGGGWAAEDTQKQEVQSSTSKISCKETDVPGAHLAASLSNRESTRGLTHILQLASPVSVRLAADAGLKMGHPVYCVLIARLF